MHLHAMRLLPNQDLKQSLENFVNKNKITSGIVLTCVGSLNCAVLRMADENVIKTFNQKFEIVSLVGTFSTDGCHLHISLSDKDGNVIGGHLKEGCLIYTTAEVVIGELTNFLFSREFDEQTGFKELTINKQNY